MVGKPLAMWSEVHCREQDQSSGLGRPCCCFILVLIRQCWKAIFGFHCLCSVHGCGTWYMSYAIWKQIRHTDLGCWNGRQKKLRLKLCANVIVLKRLDEKEALQLLFSSSLRNMLTDRNICPFGHPDASLLGLISVRTPISNSTGRLFHPTSNFLELLEKRTYNGIFFLR